MKTEKKPQSNVRRNKPINLSFNSICKFLVLLILIATLSISTVISQEVWRITFDRPIRPGESYFRVVTNKDGYTYRLNYNWEEYNY